MTKWTIYCHIHLESGRRYVGLTKMSMLKRWNRHVYCAMRALKGTGTSYFANAIRKYGKDAFSHELLQVCSSLEEANRVEQYWIDLYGTRNPIRGFNLTNGGSHMPHPIKNPWDRPEFKAANAGRNVAHILTPQARAKQQISLRSPESKAKRSALAKAALARPETKAKRKALYEDPSFKERISGSLKTSLASDEVRVRMSEASRASATLEVRERRSMSLKGVMSRPETRAKLSEASKQNWSRPEVREKILSRDVSDETRAKLSTAAKGRKHTPEAKARMAELARQRWADPSVRAAHADGIRRSKQA